MYDVTSFLLSQGENDSAVARKLKVSRQTIARWKKNPDSMPMGMCRRLANIKGYTLTATRKERDYEL